MIRPAYKYDVIHLTGATVPAIQDPAGADGWTGITEQTFMDADGRSLTSIFLTIGAKDNDAVVRFSRDGTTWGDDITIYSDDNPITRYLKAQRMQMRNDIAGANADVQAEIYG